MAINVKRVGLPVLVASGLILGMGGHPAVAEPELGAPQLQSVRLEPPNAYLTFVDHSDEESSFYVNVWERDNPDRIVAGMLQIPATPGAERVATREVSGVPTGVPLCARLFASGYVFLNAKRSPDSNTVCTDPSVEAAAPDIAVWKVDGPEEQEWAKVNGWKSYNVYRVEFENEGADANGTVVVDVEVWEKAIVHQVPTWRNGFSCGATPTGFRCTGGSLKHGEHVLFAVPVEFTGPGLGAHPRRS